MQNDIPDSLVEKIAKLLRLANSDNEHEADLALERAQKLATQYNIDLAAIQIYEGDKKPLEKIEKQTVDLQTARKSITQQSVSRILINHFGIRLLYSGGRHSGMRLIFIGTKTDIELSIYLNNYLNSEFMRRWKKYYDKIPGVRLEERQSFIYGLEVGLGEKLENAKKKTETESFQAYGDKATEISNQYALMVVNHKERLEEFIEEEFPNLRKAYSARSTRHFNNSFESGKAEGRTINTNRVIGNSSRAMVTA